LQLMWASAAVCALVANNVGPVAGNVGPRHRIVAVNVVPKGALFAGQAIYDCGPLHLGPSDRSSPCSVMQGKGRKTAAQDGNFAAGFGSMADDQHLRWRLVTRLLVLPLVAANVVPKRALFAGQAIYDCGPLHLHGVHGRNRFASRL